MSEQTNKSSSASIGLSSCMGGTFTPLPGDTSAGNQWSLCFDKKNQSVTLGVTINTPTMLVDINNQHLTSEFGIEDIQQLVVWLFQVKSSIQHHNALKAQSDGDDSSDADSADSADSTDAAAAGS